MKHYHIAFIGRTSSSIGIAYPISANIESENRHEAIKKLYQKYEHISINYIIERDENGSRVYDTKEEIYGA